MEEGILTESLQKTEGETSGTTDKAMERRHVEVGETLAAADGRVESPTPVGDGGEGTVPGSGLTLQLCGALQRG